MPGNVTATLARFAVETSARDLPASTVRVAQHCLLDWIGCTLAGWQDPVAGILMAEVAEQGGHPQASILGHMTRASLGQAALVNGTVSHVLDFDDVHLVMNGHPSAPVIPAALAVGEQQRADGAALLAAIALGIEMECRIGALLGMSHYRRGWNPSGTVGTFGAAVAAGRLLGLDAGRMETALGAAATQAAGLQGMIRSMAMPFHSGKAAANGILAASLARRGFTATRDAFDCDQGFARTHSEGANPAAALEGLGERWLVPDTVFKYHVACYGAHPAIEAMRSLLRAAPIPADDVERIDVTVSRVIGRLCNVIEPTNSIGMKFSLPHNIAMTILGHDTGAVASYADRTLADAGLAALRQRVGITVDESFADWSTAVAVTSGGETRRSYARVDEPNRDLPDQESRLEAKFDRLAAPVVGTTATTRIRDLVRDLAGLDDTNRLIALCAARPNA